MSGAAGVGRRGALLGGKSREIGPIPPSRYRTAVSDRTTSSLAEINRIISPRGKGETEARNGGNRYLIKRWVGVLSSEASAHPLSIEISLGAGLVRSLPPTTFLGPHLPKLEAHQGLGNAVPSEVGRGGAGDAG